MITPNPYFPFEPKNSQKWPRNLFIWGKWFQIQRVLAVIPPISGAASEDAKMWWKKPPLLPRVHKWIPVRFSKKMENGNELKMNDFSHSFPKYQINQGNSTRNKYDKVDTSFMFKLYMKLNVYLIFIKFFIISFFGWYSKV